LFQQVTIDNKRLKLMLEKMKSDITTSYLSVDH